MRNTNNSFRGSSANIMPTDSVITKNNTFFDYFSYFLEIMEKMVKFIFGFPVLRWILYSSNLVTIPYIGYNIFLFNEYVRGSEDRSSSEIRIAYCVMLFLATVSFCICNMVITCSYICSNESLKSFTDKKCTVTILFCLYTISFVLSMGLIDMLRYFHSYNTDYFISALVLFLLTVNIIGLSVAIGCIIACFMFILMILRLLGWFFKRLYYLLSSNRELTIKSSSKPYDKNKTILSICLICLQPYKDRDLIYTRKCSPDHGDHEMHMECILVWLVTKKTCPICEIFSELR